MICYNVRNARKAFNALAESLDAVSRLPLSHDTWKTNADMKRGIANIIDLYPDTDKIRAPFERAVEIANTARDEETATALRKLLAELQTAHEKLTGGEKTEREYKTQLADVAASVRGMLADIAEDGTKRTDTATHGEIKSNGQPKPKLTKKRGRTLTQNELKSNARRNELITEIRRRAKANFTRGAEGIAAAYDEIDAESKQAGSKWQKIITLTPRRTIIDKARHNKKYVTTQ